jgi:acetolactate synthase I/II/III large subunit
MLGDGAAGFSLTDADTLVRHNLPVVMIGGNSGAGGLERHPMRMLCGFGPARRAFDSGIPYLISIATDPEIVYPRSATGV